MSVVSSQASSHAPAVAAMPLPATGRSQGGDCASQMAAEMA